MDPFEYVLDFDYSAAALLIVILIHFYVKRTIKTKQNNVFSFTIIAVFLATIFDIASVHLLRADNDTIHGITVVATNLYHLSFFLIPVFFLYYLMIATGSFEKDKKNSRLKLYIPFIFADFLIITSTLTGWVYEIGVGYYKNGDYHFLLYLVSFVYAFFIVVEVIKQKNEFDKVQKVSLIFFIIFALLGSFMQIIWPYCILIQFFISLSVLIIYIAIENPESFEDKKLSIFNYNAFRALAVRSIEVDDHLHIIMIRLNDFKFINNVVGLRNGDELLRQVSDYLNQVSKKHFIACRISGIQFALVQKKPTRSVSDEVLQKTMEEVEKRFLDPFEINGISVSISASVYKLSYPEDVKSVDDIIATVDFLINEFYADNFEALMAKKRRENQVIQIMKDALDNNGFEVYYQLIYDRELKRYRSAEALVRLFDDNLGFITPEEFIPLAERNGMIISIGDFVLHETCKFIKENKIYEKGIEYVEVNLSSLQCMQRGWHEKLLGIIDSYGLPHKLFNFEITETADVINDEILKESMNKLIKEGITFSLDDYGTGFSNTSYITTFPYEIVKIDKKLIWDAMENNKAMILLKNTINMLNEMDLKMVAEGVETEEHVRVLSILGCKFFQGYRYARPLPKKQVLKKLEEGFLEK